MRGKWHLVGIVADVLILALVAYLAIVSLTS